MERCQKYEKFCIWVYRSETRAGTSHPGPAIIPHFPIGVNRQNAQKNQQVLVNLLIEYLCKKCAYNFIEHRGVNVHIKKAVILAERFGVASNQFRTQCAFRALGGVVSARTDSMNFNARDRILFRVFADFITQTPYNIFRGSAYLVKFKFVVVVKLEKVNRLNVFQILATIRHKLHRNGGSAVLKSAQLNSNFFHWYKILSID